MRYCWRDAVHFRDIGSTRTVCFEPLTDVLLVGMCGGHVSSLGRNGLIPPLASMWGNVTDSIYSKSFNRFVVATNTGLVMKLNQEVTHFEAWVRMSEGIHDDELLHLRRDVCCLLSLED